MARIDYKKILDTLMKNYHHELDKIEKVIKDAKKGKQYRNSDIDLSFDEIVNDKEWTALEKERLIRFFGYEKDEHELEYVDKYNNTKKMSEYFHMITYGNLSGFTAYMNCFKDIEHDRETTKDGKYRHILNQINRQTHKEYISLYELKNPQVMSKEQELTFMKTALNILTEEDKMRLCADYYETHLLDEVQNKSIFINIIKTENTELIDEYIGYIDNISAYFPYVVETGNIQLVKYFLDLGADINYYPKEAIYGLLTPLKMAIMNNDYEMVQFLIDNGADINLSVQEDTIKNIQNTSLSIFDRYTHSPMQIQSCKANDKEVKELEYIRKSTPIEYATTLSEKYVYHYNSSRYYILFEGQTYNATNEMKVNNGNYTKEQINRSKIVHTLFETLEEPKKFDATNLLSTVFITQDTKNINQYIDYIIEHHMAIDMQKIFHIVLSLELHNKNNVFHAVIRLIEKYSSVPSKTYKEWFDMYQKKYISTSFSFKNFSETLLNKMNIEDRKDIILMPYAKDMETINKLLELGFDINQTDENGKNILFHLLSRNFHYHDISKEEKQVFEFLVSIDSTTNQRVIDIALKDKNNKNALYYALQSFDTENEYKYGNKEQVYTYTEFENVLADFIELLPTDEVNNLDNMKVLEERMTECFSDFGEKIYAEFIYQHHKKLISVLRKKMVFSDKIYKEIFRILYTKDERPQEYLNRTIQMDATIDFLYETLDRNTAIQKLSIDDEFDKYQKYVKRVELPFEEFECIITKLVFDIDELGMFYEQNVTKKYDSERYLKYVKDKYNVSYRDLPSYLLRMILLGIQKYGNEKLPSILKLCPSFDINTVGYNIDSGINIYQYFDEIETEENLIENSNRYEAANIKYPNGNIIFTGGLIHYGILRNDIHLVKYLKKIGAKTQLMIEGEDYAWDYVSSYEMETLLEPRKDKDGLTADEKKYLYSL